MRTPREALLYHIEPQGACKLTTDQSLTGQESMGHEFPSLQRRNLQYKEFPEVCGPDFLRTQFKFSKLQRLYWTCQVHEGGSDTLCIVIPDRHFRIYPVHDKLWLPAAIMGQKKKRTLKQSSCNLTCKICDCDG